MSMQNVCMYPRLPMTFCLRSTALAAPTHHSRGVRVKDGLGARLRVVSEDVGGVGPAQGSLLHAAVRWRAHTGWSYQSGGSVWGGQTPTASPAKRYSWSTENGAEHHRFST